MGKRTQISPGFTVEEVTDAELAAVSPVYREALERRKVKGLRAGIYKHGGASYANGGISGDVDDVTIVGIAQAGDARPLKIEPVYDEARVFEPDEKAPPVAIVHRLRFGPYAVPVAIADDGTMTVKGEGVGPMAGGCYIATSDGRFRELTGRYEPVALHDRFETPEQYASYD